MYTRDILYIHRDDEVYIHTSYTHTCIEERKERRNEEMRYERS